MRKYLLEDHIEQACIDRCMTQLEYNKHFNCMDVDFLRRKSEKEVLYKYRLVERITKLNKGLTNLMDGLAPEDAEAAFNKLAGIDLMTAPQRLNQEVLTLIREGVKMPVHQKGGKTELRTVQFIDWEHPEKNNFTVVNQLWIEGKTYRCRPDVIIYVNGIPLVTFELKDTDVPVEEAYTDNLTRYKEQIPQLMAYNMVLVASNGKETRVGATYAPWDYFTPWLHTEEGKRITKEDRAKIQDYACSLDYFIMTLCNKAALIDYLRNFVIFKNGVKICAQNHQFLGVNSAIERFAKTLEEGTSADDRSRLGVFWHTQGSGKSFSMVFFANKIVREFSGNYTFLVVTDREDLDDQIYGYFVKTGFIGPKQKCRPKDSNTLREMLGGQDDKQHESLLSLEQDHKIIFTLIQKFRYPAGKTFPVLSERSDIIVIIDEAHRTQYKTLAENLRHGLPNAKYIAFTGTPLFGSKQLTNRWFGPNVSTYQFFDAIDDGATLPLSYTNHLPEMQNKNPHFNEEFMQLMEEENLTDAERERLEDEYAKTLHVLKREGRLREIADDIVDHFVGRGFLGKGMVISVDKFATVMMYDYVREAWQKKIKDITESMGKMDFDSEAYKQWRTIRDWMRKTEMAVIVSEEAGEDEKFKKVGLTIAPHRKRMQEPGPNGDSVEDQFKDPDHPLRLVFVCSMWLTGFDAPTVSTLYLDKPSMGHSLMQLITRANRKTSWLDCLERKKTKGQIVAYCNVFGGLKKALAEYGGNDDNDDDNDNGGDNGSSGDVPVMTIEEIYAHLHEAIDLCVAWCHEQDVDLESILKTKEVFAKVAAFDTCADRLCAPTEIRAQFNAYQNTIEQLYNEALPDIISRKREFRMAEVISFLRKVIDGKVDRSKMDNARSRMRQLLDDSILPVADDKLPMAAEDEKGAYGIKHSKEYDLSAIDLSKLQQEFAATVHKHLAIDDLTKFIEDKLNQMLDKNGERRAFVDRFRTILDQYNASSAASEQAFEDLMKFLAEMSEEEQRAQREGLTDDELEIFDILKKDNLTEKEKQQVKLAAQNLLKKMRERRAELFPVCWYSDQALKVRFAAFVGEELDHTLPKCYNREIFSEKKTLIYNHIVQRAASNRMYA